MANIQRGLLMAGNWKMFKTRAEVETFILDLAPAFPKYSQVEAMVCPSFTLLSTAQKTIKRTGLSLKVSAQTMEYREEGAFTGEVSAIHLKELELRGVLLGHSERRQYYNETSQTVNQKTKVALQYGLLPIVCVGELLEEREAGNTDAVVIEQINIALEGLDAKQIPAIVIAYEPVWAIGTGKVCETPEANRVCRLIRQQVASTFGAEAAQTLRILYGGSMNTSNAEALLSQSDIDGGLIGGASLKVDSFVELLTIANQVISQQTATVA
jgi:triosephosphate isomerase (TIM)